MEKKKIESSLPEIWELIESADPKKYKDDLEGFAKEITDARKKVGKGKNAWDFHYFFIGILLANFYHQKRIEGFAKEPFIWSK